PWIRASGCSSARAVAFPTELLPGTRWRLIFRFAAIRENQRGLLAGGTSRDSEHNTDGPRRVKRWSPTNREKASVSASGCLSPFRQRMRAPTRFGCGV
ncbi:unnamed protein product, partial [Scytosiphon promiscuus]